VEQRLLGSVNMKIWWVTCCSFLLWASALKQMFVKTNKIPSYGAVFM